MGSKKLKSKTFKDKDKLSKYGAKDMLSDSRFAHIASDPRYRNISSNHLKVKIDSRFKGALKNENFTTHPGLDPRGKPKNYGTKEGLHKFYDLESSSDSDSDEEEEEDEDSENSDVDKTVITKQKKKDKNEDREDEFIASLLNPEWDLARGDIFYSDDSSDDDSSTTDEDDEAEEELKDFEWGELDGDAQWDVDGNEVEETNRFAVCDMDWDNVKAVDMLVLFSSFAPSGGLVKKVTIYPSEFGKTRMAEEELKGPQELVRLATKHKKRHDDELSDLEKLKKGTLEESDKASTLELEALRRYQRNRLKYYYAVVECDSVETATVIYKECDRSHYEVIGVTLDLRYIPSDMEFDEMPHDICEKIPDSYEFDNVQTSSIVHCKPTLTWDETDRRRKKVLQNTMAKALKKENFNSDVLNDFVAGSDSEDESAVEEESSIEDEDAGDGKGSKEDRIAKFRALISEIDKKETTKKCGITFDMEDTFETAEEDKNAGEEENGVEREDNLSEDENDVEKQDENEDLTPFEKILMKKKQKRKERKLKLKKMRENANTENENNAGGENEENSTNEKLKTKKKGKKKKGKSKVAASNDIVPESTDNDLALMVMDEEEDEKKHFDMRKIKEQKEKMEKKRKRKSKEMKENEEENLDNFKVDTSDPRFAALFSHGSFNLDPSHPKYDKHSSLNHGIIHKQKKIKTISENDQQQVINYSNLDTEISNMIRRFRMKTTILK